jgi:hypothetical protein
MGGVIAVGTVLALIAFGSAGNNRTASNSLNTEPAVATGASPAAPSKEVR